MVACLAGGFFATEPPGKPFSSLMNNKASKHSPCQACRTFRRETQPCLDSCGPHSRTLPQTPGWRPTFTPFLPFTLWTTSKDSLFIKVKVQACQHLTNCGKNFLKRVWNFISKPSHRMTIASSSLKSNYNSPFKMEGRRGGHQRMRWLDGITDSMDTSLS